MKNARAVYIASAFIIFIHCSMIFSFIPAQGCDGSILLASPNNKAEKDHPDDISLAGDGFDTVAKAKAAVDSVPQCRNRVSCADILALATRDVINLVYNFHITFLLSSYTSNSSVSFYVLPLHAKHFQLC